MQFVLIDGPMTNNVTGRFMVIYAELELELIVLPESVPGPGLSQIKTHGPLPDLG